ncbi:MAG TPA: UDP-N-acetylmuramoyl-L-alanine--D-glutamate ligase [Anaerolineaceae bacterium]|nr:UDP-N-acetylmuramoyl-L-alanine--D-glutamate ligase [Anaerolineaceae bacterium]
MSANFEKLRVVVLGAARQGLAQARYFSRKGAFVTISDRQTTEQLQGSIQAMADYPVNWVTGGHPLTLLEGTDLICVSGGVPLTLPIITEAQKLGITVTNDSAVFMQAVKAPVVGITGSAGKTTTTTLIGRMAAAGIKAPSTVHVGGNIGNPLIELVDEIDPQDLVILELSSFQLDLMNVSPHIAAVLNITPNHLDRHGTMEAYINAKANILLHQGRSDIAILNRDDAESWNLRKLVSGSLVSFGMHKPNGPAPAVYFEQGQVMLSRNNIVTPLLDTSLIQLRGEHNLMNVMAACALATAIGLTPAAMEAGVTGFTGVSHRFETVRVVNGVTWINDSIATAPERTLADLRSFSEPVVLLLGGRDKNLPWQDLARVVHSRVEHVVLFGEARQKIAEAIGNPQPADRLSSVSVCETLQDALEQARTLAKDGDVVLLSPGCTSYDAFKDFEERGEFFHKWVNDL